MKQTGTAGRLSGLLAVAAMLLAMVSYTCGASVAERLFPAVGAEGTTAIRLAGGALMLGAVLQPGPRAWRAVRGWWVVAYGLAMGVMNLLFYMALRTVPLGIAIAIEFTGPLAVAVLSSRTLTHLLWITLAVAGLAVLLPIGGGTLRGVDPTGAACALGAGACWAIYIVTGKRVGRDGGMAGAVFGMAVGSIVVLPIGFFHAGLALFRPKVLLPGLLVACLSSALPYALEMAALRRLPMRAYGTLVSAEPAIGAVIGFLVLGQTLSPAQGIAIACIMAAAAGAALGAIGTRPDALDAGQGAV